MRLFLSKSVFLWCFFTMGFYNSVLNNTSNIPYFLAKITEYCFFYHSKTVLSTPKVDNNPILSDKTQKYQKKQNVKR